MKIKLIVSRSGSDGAFAPGDIIDVSNEEAERMVSAGQGEIVRSQPRETTAKPATYEKAVK